MASAQSLETKKLVSAASLLFPAGERPDASVLRALAAQESAFSLSIDPQMDGGKCEGWVELLSSGLTFDLTGLSPHPGDAVPERAHSYGFEDDQHDRDLEAITLFPGPHLSGGSTMFPVVRCLAMLAAHLTRLDGVLAVAWHPARAWSHADYFRRGVMAWVEGGAFPGLGLAALANRPDGSLESEGLSLFTGQELRFPPGFTTDRAETAKIALRLLNWLVEHGHIDEAIAFTGPSGEPLTLEPVENCGILQVWRGSL